MEHRSALIIGGGISGLSAAYYLGRRGISSTVVEKSSRLGGLIGTRRVEDCELELGPDSFIASKGAVQELAAELGIQDRIIASNDAHRRIFIARSGSLQPLPPGMVMMAPANLKAAVRSPFFSTRSKFRFIRELLLRPRRRPADVSVEEFVVDHFGREILETVAEPLLTGVYGGDPAQLSVRSVLPRFVACEERYGSLIRGVRRELGTHGPRQARKGSGSFFLSFKGGMQTLTDTLARNVEKFTRTVTAEAQHVQQIAGGWRVHTSEGLFEAASLILAVPAWAAATMIESLDADTADLLRKISYSSAILTTFVFDRDKLLQVLNGFGFLVPRRERRTIAAATWIGTKFPDRIPANKTAIRTFIVGETALRLKAAPDVSVLSESLKDLRHWMTFAASPLFEHVQHWPDSMPQYSVGHADRVADLRSRLQRFSGLYLCGNAYNGVGIPDCVRLAKDTIEKLGVT